MLDTPLRATVITLGLIVLASSLLACVPVQPAVLSGAAATPTTAPAATPAADDDVRPAGWTEATHSNDVDPNYDVVFPIDAINTLTITIAPDDWAAMQADLEDIYAPSLYIRQGILAAGPDLSQEERDKLLLELVASRAAERSATALVTVSETVTTTGVTTAPALKEQMVFNRSPMWVPATITFQGQECPSRARI